MAIHNYLMMCQLLCQWCVRFILGSSEDPLFSRVIHSGQETNKRIHCSFDSSQEPSVVDGNGSYSAISSAQLLAVDYEREGKILHQSKDGTGSLESQANNDGGEILDSIIAFEECAGVDRCTTSVIGGEHGPKIALCNRTCSVGINTDSMKEGAESGDAAIHMSEVMLAPNLAAEWRLNGTLEEGCCHQLCSNKHTNAVEVKYGSAVFLDTNVIPSYSNFMPHRVSSSASELKVAEIVPNTISHKATILPMERTNENLCQALEWQSWWFSSTSSNTLVHSRSRKMEVGHIAMDSFPCAPVNGEDVSNGNTGGFDEHGASRGGGGKCGKTGGVGYHADGSREERVRVGEDELERLRERLEMSESTVMWQSLIIRLYRMNEQWEEILLS